MQAPIFHVNGDDPEAAIRVVQIAFDYRQQFKKDVVIDMFCYRRHGHNEGDDPELHAADYVPQDQGASVRSASSMPERLVREGVATEDEVQTHAQGISPRAFRPLTTPRRSAPSITNCRSSARSRPRRSAASARARRSIEQVLERVIGGITQFPGEFPSASQAARLRGASGATPSPRAAPIDWAFGEALAFGSLVLEGTPVRLSGQDSGRGTFSQRHLAFYDSETGKRYVPAAAHRARPGAASTSATAR